MPKTRWQTSSRVRAPRSITNPTMMLFFIALATITHASPDDECRGNCDQVRGLFCLDWTGSCEKCLNSTQNAKCIAYFKSLEAPSQDGPPSLSTRQEPPSTEAPQSVADERTNVNEDGSDPHPNRSSDQPARSPANPAEQDPSLDQPDHSDTHSDQNPAKPNDSEDPRPKSQEVPDDRDSDGTLVGGAGESSSSSSLFFLKISVVLAGTLVVVVTGGVVIRRRQRSRPPTAITVEGQQNANEGENQALNQAHQEEGDRGGTLALPNTDLYVKNEAHGDGDVMETAV